MGSRVTLRLCWGETLDAIQQLTNYSVNRGGDKRVRVHVDAENYRLNLFQRKRSLYLFPFRS